MTASLPAEPSDCADPNAASPFDPATDDLDPEPRWQALIAIVATGGLYLALPEGLTVGPRWVFPLLVALLLAATVALHLARKHRLDRVIGFTLTGLMTLQLITSTWLLIHALPSHSEPPTALLTSAASIWITNILVFALWYWRLDAGGPHGRERRVGHTEGAFLFPQMTLSADARSLAGYEQWSPNFVDYLFVAFNTSTAFSPTDTAVLARWAKLLMMLQSFISLTVVALLAGRAVNIL